MAQIRETTRSIVDKIKDYGAGKQTRPEAPFSPVQGVHFFETASTYVSADEKIKLRKVLGGRVMRQEEIVDLLEGKTIGPYADFRSKGGKLFTASLALKEGKVEFIFPDATDRLDQEEIRQSPPLGLSPVDQTQVFETPAAFMSESALNGDKEKGLRISKVILGRRIDPEHISQLLATGKTALIKGFISKKKKPFDAYLLLDGKGKLSFEFPPRKPRKGSKKTADSADSKQE
jgi:DNA topoisomerase-3